MSQNIRYAELFYTPGRHVEKDLKPQKITEAIINHHDELFVACSSGKKVEDMTPKFAKQCNENRKKMKELVEEYLLEYSKS